MAEANYLIWSNEHRAWWRENRSGHTTRLAEAGFYTRAAAIAICADARRGWKVGEAPPEIMVLAVDAHEALATAIASQAHNVGRLFREIVGGRS